MSIPHTPHGRNGVRQAVCTVGVGTGLMIFRSRPLFKKISSGSQDSSDSHLRRTPSLSAMRAKHESKGIGAAKRRKEAERKRGEAAAREAACNAADEAAAAELAKKRAPVADALAPTSARKRCLEVAGTRNPRTP